MTTCVIDASVAAKWFLPSENEPLAEEALALARRYSKGEVNFIVPDLFWAEIANVFWKAARQKRWGVTAAQDALRHMLERAFPSVSSARLAGSALEIATAFDRSIYDSLYVALAMEAKTYLLTADERLVRALAPHLPVKWLGNL